MRPPAPWIPTICAALNGAALIGLALNAPGTEIGGSTAARAAFITAHRLLWSAGWSLYIAAALSLLTFLAWWAAHLRRGSLRLVAVGVAGIGIAFDIAGETIYLTQYPGGIDGIGHTAFLMSTVIANALYTMAGIWLTLLSPQISGMLRVVVWIIWTGAIALSILGAVHIYTGVAVASAIAFVLFVPWVILAGRRLGGAGA